MDAVHLPEVEDVEAGAETGSIEPALGADRDPLRREGLLREVAREGRRNRNRKDDHPDHPGHGPTAPPAGHEVLTPEVQHHEDEEDLDAPEVQAIEESAGPRDVPPIGACE